MPLYKFGRNDLFYNRIKTHPKTNFLIYSGSVFYNSNPFETGSLLPPAKGGVAFNHSGNITHTPVGDISLYELNVDRPEEQHTYKYGDGTGVKSMIHPFVHLTSDAYAFKTISTASVNTGDVGDILTASFKYPLSASISRRHYFSDKFESKQVKFFDPTDQKEKLVNVSSSYIHALKNTLNHYKPMSRHYEFSASGDWDKAIQSVNFINIPSMFYGSAIKKGTVDLRFYLSGTLIGQCTDINQNGELIQIGPTGSGGSGSVAGVVLYNEGILLLTGSWNISEHTDAINKLSFTGGTAVSPRWEYWGTGVPLDGSGSDGYYSALVSASYWLEFKGTNYTPVVTMLAHAERGRLNHSNNPTYIDGNVTGSEYDSIIFSGSSMLTDTGSLFYHQHNKISIKNIVSSSYNCHTASFKKETYISKIGIYDENKNLLGVAKVATPVKKTEERDYTFKLKLDI